MIFDTLDKARNEILLFAERPNLHEDHKEFLELIIIFLMGNLNSNVNFQQPGACHLARWMANGIYSIQFL